MKTYIMIAAMILLPGLATSAALAAKATTKKEDLQREATHIVIGTVQKVSSSAVRKGDLGYLYHTAEIAVQSVEKGSGVQPGTVIQARYLSIRFLGNNPPPGDSGHWPLPQQGDVVRVYLVNKGYNGGGYTTDGGFDVYYKNGFEILKTH